MEYLRSVFKVPSPALLQVGETKCCDLCFNVMKGMWCNGYSTKLTSGTCGATNIFVTDFLFIYIPATIERMTCLLLKFGPSELLLILHLILRVLKMAGTAYVSMNTWRQVLIPALSPIQLTVQHRPLPASLAVWLIFSNKTSQIPIMSQRRMKSLLTHWSYCQSIDLSYTSSSFPIPVWKYF